MTKDEALKLALEALEEAWYHVGTFQPTEKAIDLYDEARTAIKEALAQPEQEPVAWVSSEELLVMRGNALGGAKDWRINVGLVKQDGDVGLYTTPPQRKPLINEMREQMRFLGFDTLESRTPFVAGWLKAEAAHGIKGEA